MFELCDRLFGIYKVRNCTSATFIAPEMLELDEKKKPNKNNQTQATTSAAVGTMAKENEENENQNEKTLIENTNKNNSIVG